MAKQYKLMKVSPNFENLANSLKFELQLLKKKKKISYYDVTNHIVEKLESYKYKKIQL